MTPNPRTKGYDREERQQQHEVSPSSVCAYRERLSQSAGSGAGGNTASKTGSTKRNTPLVQEIAPQSVTCPNPRRRRK